MDTSPPNRERERNLALERERQIEMASSRATTSCTYDTGLREEPPTLAQRDLIATVLDLKVDVRLEMQRMSQRIGKIEDLLQELCKKITVIHDSSGQTTPGDCIDVIPSILSHTLTLTTACESTRTTQAASIQGGNSGQVGGSSDVVITPTSTATNISAPPTTSQLHVPCSGGNGLGPILLKKRRSKSRKAPAPPKHSQTSPEQTRLLEAELIATTSSTPTTTSTPTTSTSSKSKRDFL